jgi:hypothetical protein
MALSALTLVAADFSMADWQISLDLSKLTCPIGSRFLLMSAVFGRFCKKMSFEIAAKAQEPHSLKKFCSGTVKARPKLACLQKMHKTHQLRSGFASSRTVYF